MHNRASTHSEDLEPPPEFSSLVELLRWRALHQPDAVGYIFLADGEAEELRLTYAELDRKARAIAALLQSLQAGGERALLLYPSGLDYVAAFFGCLYAQVVAVPAYPPRRADRKLPRISAIVKDCKPLVALGTAATQSTLAPLLDVNPDLQGMRLLATDNLDEEWAERWREPECAGETLAFLQYTSGSTAAPKGVMVSHGNLLHNELLIKQAFRQTERSVIVGWLPLYHDMGLIGNVLQPLYLGATCVLMSPTAFLQSPFRWLSAISRYKATTSGAPNFAYDLCARRISPEQRATLDLSNWTTAFNGAEPVRDETLKRFAATFAPQGFREESLSPCYGLAEATLIVTGGVKAGPDILHTVRASGLERNVVLTAPAGDADTQTLVSCGRALPDQQVIIVDPESATLSAPDSVGEVWVAGPSVAQGYWDMPEETERTFRAHLADTGEGPFLRTGDLGYLNNGQLFVTGRLKDLIIIRGRNHYPQDIELTVERSHTALRPGGGAAFSVEAAGEERLVVAQEVEHRRLAGLNVAEVVDAVRQALAEEHELQAHAVLLLRAGTIPKTSSGKIQRHACRVKFQEGTLDTVGEWRASTRAQAKEIAADPEAPLRSPEDIEAWLKSQLAAKLRMDASDIDVNHPITRYGVDSLAAIELAHGVEARLGVTLPVVSFLESLSVAQLASRLVTELAATPDAAGVRLAPSDNPTAEHPLSYGQRSLYFLYQLAPDSSAYNIGGAARIRTELDARALRRAFQRLVDRHASLRTVFTASDEGLPVQLVREPAEVNFREEDARDWTEEALDQRLAEEANRPFRLDEGSLLRVALFKRAAREHVLALTLHHIVADFWSLSVLVNELGILYSAERTGERVSLPPVALQYSDYARWQGEVLNGDGAARLWGYWERQLAGDMPVLNLPTDRPRPAVQSYRGASHPFELGAELAEGLRATCKSQGVTLYMVLLAAFQVMLRRYTGQESLLVGSPTAGRTAAGLAGLVGYFVNPVVLRADFSGDPTFAEFLGQVRRTVLDAFEHQDYPFALLVERLQPARDPSRSPIFQTMFVLQKSQLHEDEGLAAFALGEAGAKMELGGLSVESVAQQQRSAQFDLTLMVSETPGSMAATIEYSTDLFEAETVERMGEHFRNLLASLVGDPSQPVSELEMLSRHERRQLLVGWNETAESYEARCLHHLVEAQAGRTPEATAITFGREEISYARLNERANKVAHHLRSLGVRAESRVGILMERSVDLVVGLLGILKAGAAYVPLDPQYPRQRLSFMLSDSGADVLLTRGALLPAVPDHGGRVVLMESLNEEQDAASTRNPDTEVGADNLAYVIYTSGSTGRPKGVAICHRSAAALLHWAERAFSAEELSAVLASTSICFDLSIFELFVPLSGGGRVVLVENALALPESAADSGVTLVNTVPSAMAELLRTGGVPSSVLGINLAGEALSGRLVREVYEQTTVERVRNLYGPSEDTTYSTWVEVPREGAREPSIGRPITNTQAYILGSAMEVVAVGVAGELYLGGDGLARGYLGRPDVTAEKFVPNPFGGAGTRLYRTGDLARYLPDGQIEFLGRIDTQVKVRGYRIELGEIETAVREQEGVEAAVVVVDTRREHDHRVVAYVVAAGGARLDVRRLRISLREKLPEVMVPSAFVQLDELPLTPNGKVDRKALPEPQQSSEGDFDEARTPVEEVLVGLWREVLGVERVGVRDNFFDLGGHSLLATQLMSRLGRALSVELPLRTLFEHPTIEGLARVVEEHRRAGATPPPPLVPVGRDGELPLSFAQQRLWFLDQLEPGSAAYNLAGVVRLRGELNVEALRMSIGEVVRRHESLRTVFASVDGRPVQVIREQIGAPLAVVNLSEAGAGRGEEAAREFFREEGRRPFDLSAGPLVRFVLAETAEGEHLLGMTMHHIISDGWSMGVLIEEIGKLYEAYSGGADESPLEELEIQYADFAVWQRRWLSGETLERQLDYWKRQLQGAPPVLELPTDKARPAVRSFRGARESFLIPEDLTREIRALGQREGATLFMTLLAAFNVLLARYAGSDEVVVGTPIAGRQQVETEGLIGFFVNTLVLRADLSGDPAFRDLLGRVRDATLAAYEHQDVPFEKLVEELRPGRTLGHAPLFQVMLALQNAAGRSELELAGLDVERVEWAGGGTSKFDLTLSLTEQGEGLEATLEYSADLFEAETIERMGGHFRNLLASLVGDPSQPISELEMLGAEERQQLLVSWNDTAEEYETRCLHQLVEAQAARTPDAPAVTFRGEKVSYAELNARANKVAHHLRGLGVGAESRVGVLMERSIDLIVGLLGVLKAGAAYVPLDPQYPQQRLSYMIEDSGVGVLLSDRDVEGLGGARTRVVSVSRRWAEVSGESGENPRGAVTVDNLAYVIYTSGSTGVPKGVMVSHRAICNHLLWRQSAFPLTDSDRFIQKASFSFDISVWEIFGTLLSGAHLILIGEDEVRDSAHLVGVIAEQEITVAHFGPPMLRVFLEEPGVENCKHLRRVFCGGEPLSPDLQERFFARLGAELYHQYGPTEASVDVTVRRCERGSRPRAIPIGRPISNTQIYLLDRHLNPVPVGVAGELYVGGDSLARGYLNRPGLTAEKFIPNPYGRPGTLLYRTGDLARYLADGEIEFIGRIDTQVKVRGYRVELGEIEAALAAHEEVHAAVVVAGEGAHGDQRIVAYVVPSDGGLSETQLRSYVRARLPEYMTPSAFVLLDELPLTPNGKVDRKALPAPQQQAAGGGGVGDFDEARTPVEEVLVGLWREVLGVERVGVRDNFFDLGGHSLLATQLVSRVRHVLRVEMPLRQLFEHPTVEGLARVVEEGRRGDAPAPPPLVRAARDGELPLSFAQQRLWFLEQLEPGGAAYHLAGAVRLRGALDLGALRRAVAEVVRRHESLRTVFAAADGRPIQIIRDQADSVLAVVDLRELSAERRQEATLRLLDEQARRPFDLAAGPLVRFVLAATGGGEHVLGLSMHHIISDGWSMGVLMREVGALYGAFAGGAARSPLAELEVQYADFAVWQRRWLSGETLERQLSYWREQLSGAPALLELPTDRPRPPVQSFRGATHHFTISRELTDGLGELSRREGATLFMTLLGAWQVLLSRYSGQADIVVGSPIANRTRVETEGLIGFFVNTLVLRADLSGDPAFRELLGRVRDATLAAYEHQDVPFEKLVEELRPGRTLGHAPLFQVMLALQNAGRGELELAGLEAEHIDQEVAAAKFDLTLSLTERGGQLEAVIEYSADLFEASSIERMGEHFRNLLASLVGDPSQPISELEMLGAEERDRLLIGWNETSEPYEARCLHELFEAQAARTPGAVAVTFGGEDVTYRELDARADSVARHLRGLGVGAESRVAVLMERSTDLVAGLIGILKSGAAYVPLDPQYPRQRLAFMLSDSGAGVLLTRGSLREVAPPAPGTRVVLMEELGEGEGEVTDEREEGTAPSSSTPPSSTITPPLAATPDNLAYVIYTSGSTGVPKGVAICHRSAAALLGWAGRAFTAGELAAVLASTSICFDLSVFELFVPLSLGGRVVLVENALALVGGGPGAAGVTLINTVPSAMTELLRAGAVPGSVLGVNLAGEALSSGLAREVYEQTRARVVRNLYGPSEDTTYSTWAEVGRGAEGEPPIGRPVSNTRAYVLGARMEAVAAGVAGELYLGGDGLARGYLGRPAATAERFVPDPYGPAGSRLYRTGDLARWRADGELEFLGRMDTQVKVRGYRIELGEIEAALRAEEGVGAAAVVLDRGRGDDARVVAYVAGAGPGGVDVGRVRAGLRERLPEVMVPSQFVVLDELPLTPNGKVDRKALPAPGPRAGAEGDDYVAARTPLEEALAALWREVLGVERVGIRDNFFDLGGHSLLATQLVSRINRDFGVELPLRQLFEHPNIAELAAIIESQQGSQQVGRPGADDVPEIQVVPRGRENLEDILARLEQLSEEEAAKIISENKLLLK